MRTLPPFQRGGLTPSTARPTPRASQTAPRENAINITSPHASAASNPPANAPPARRILVIEDERDIAQLVGLHLRDLNFHVDIVHDGALGLERALAQPYDLIVLDLMLPGLDGLEVCRRLRARQGQGGYTLILMLTSKGTELDRVLGLELGADDYLAKPFSIRELLARVKALFRRAHAMEAGASTSHADCSGESKSEPGVIRSGELVIEIDKRKVSLGGEEVSLTAKEFDLLHVFACHPGRVYTRTQLLDSVWGLGYEHTVNSHINRLRAKIEDDHARPKYLLTVWGVGYKFAEPSELAEPKRADAAASR